MKTSLGEAIDTGDLKFRLPCGMIISGKIKQDKTKIKIRAKFFWKN